MRVTFFHYLYDSPGSVIQVHEFAQAFRELGHEISVHGMDANPVSENSSRKKWKQGLGAWLHEFNSLWKNAGYLKREREIVRREKPDVILTRYKLYHISSLKLARESHIPLVTWMHALALHEHRHYENHFFRIPGLGEKTEKEMIQGSDRVIVVSEELKQYLSNGTLPSSHFKVVSNGVDAKKFKPSENNHGVRSKFPVKDAVVLGFVGSFSPWHGIQTLKSWIPYVLTSFPQACFLLIGDGPLRKELEKNDRVVLTGQIEHSQVAASIQAMDICLLPYEQTESFYFSPLKLFEYMACAKSVLARGIGQIQKVMEDGQSGMLYETMEEAQEKLKMLIENSDVRKRLGENARRKILESYTWRHTAQAVEEVLKEALRDHKQK